MYKVQFIPSKIKARSPKLPQQSPTHPKQPSISQSKKSPKPKDSSASPSPQDIEKKKNNSPFTETITITPFNDQINDSTTPPLPFLNRSLHPPLSSPQKKPPSSQPYRTVAFDLIKPRQSGVTNTSPPILIEPPQVPSMPSVLSLNEEDIRFKEERQVEITNLTNGTSKQALKQHQSLRILEQIAQKGKTVAESLLPHQGIKPTLHFARTTRSASPRLKPINPIRMKELKQVAFLHVASPLTINPKSPPDIDDTFYYLKDLISDCSLDLTYARKPPPRSVQNNLPINSNSNKQRQSNALPSLQAERPPVISTKPIRELKPQIPLIEESNHQTNKFNHIMIEAKKNVVNRFKLHKQCRMRETDIPEFVHNLLGSNSTISSNPTIQLNSSIAHNTSTLNSQLIASTTSTVPGNITATTTMTSNTTTTTTASTKEKQKNNEIELSDTYLSAFCLNLLLNKFEGSSAFSNTLASEAASLEVLRLVRAGLEADSMAVLSNSLSINKSLIVLDLSNNSIANDSCNDIKFIMISNPSLRELYLKWNKFTADGMATLFDILTRNSSLKVLDISNNSIGHGTSIAIRNININTTTTTLPESNIHMEQIYFYFLLTILLEKLTNAFERLMTANTPLLHVDMRNNCLSPELLECFRVALTRNSSILGIHFSSGNNCCMDAMNFLRIFEQSSVVQLPSQCEYLPIDSVNKLRQFRRKKNNVIEDFQVEESDNCWICEGWIEQEFTCTILSASTNQWNQSPTDMNVFLHLEIDCYRPTTMVRRSERDSNGNTNYSFTSKRMIPPKTRIKFYFSSDGRNALLLSSNHDTVIVPFKRIQPGNTSLSNTQEYAFASETIRKAIEASSCKDFFKVEGGTLYIKTFNVLEGTSVKPCVSPKTFLPSNFLKPRQDIYLNPGNSRYVDQKQQQQQSQSDELINSVGMSTAVVANALAKSQKLNQFVSESDQLPQLQAQKTKVKIVKSKQSEGQNQNKVSKKIS